MNKVLLFNPRSARSKHRIPNSILQVGASINNKFEFVFVDGNLESDPWTVILNHFNTGEFRFFGCTVMPGPQLKQAIPFSKKLKHQFPFVTVIWGGYFASNQFGTVIKAPYVDFIVNGPGDIIFPLLLEKIISNESTDALPGLIYLKDNKVIKNPVAALPDQDTLPQLPYEYLNKQYPLSRYLGKTFLGSRTATYHSSMGCPFTCSFCAVVPIYNARWKGKSAELIYQDIKYLKENYGADAVEFHDNNFFVSEKRTVEFSRLVRDEKISWWGEGRIDTINKYSDESLALMREAGCRMIFFGAETSNDDLLKKMDKGGTQTTAQIKSFAARMKKFDIIPEYSFVLGFPLETEALVNEQIDRDINYIKEIKEINPSTEIIIYVYSPVATEGSELYKQVTASGFRFPETLDEWLSPVWQNFDLRKNPLTPWLKPDMIDKIKAFETVLNARYPTISDFRLSPAKRKVMKMLSDFRYRKGLYKFPYDLKILHRLWRYRQPETEGFVME